MNYLYFYKGTAASDAGVAYPVSSLRCVEQTGDGTIEMHFTPLEVTDVVAGAPADSNRQNDSVILTVTSGKEKEVMEDIAKAVNESVVFSSGFVNIADDENGLYVSSNIIDIAAESTASHPADGTGEIRFAY